MSIHLTSIPYGKSSVRLTKVRRGADKHELVELSVDVSLDGDFQAAFTDGDNRKVIATDSIRNTVLVLAREQPIDCIESFGRCLASHFVDRYEQVENARVQITETLWQRLDVDGVPHPHAFSRGGSEVRTSTVERDRSAGESVASGLGSLVILKTTGSGFSNFVRDEFTRLADTDDRLLATELEAQWRYPSGAGAIDWTACRQRVRTALLETFAQHDSLSVQHTLYAMGEAALAAASEIYEIRLTMPNKHHLLADLTPFNRDNAGEVLVPTAEPFGNITGTLRRSDDETSD
jgi:urate oxidase